MAWFQCWIEKLSNKKKRSRSKYNNRNLEMNPGRTLNKKVRLNSDL